MCCKWPEANAAQHQGHKCKSQNHYHQHIQDPGRPIAVITAGDPYIETNDGVAVEFCPPLVPDFCTPEE